MAAVAAAAVLGMAGCQVDVGSGGGGDGTGATANPGTGAADAAAQLEELTVGKAGSMSGYSREKFPHWRDTGPNCDMRDTILQRDGKNITLDGCNVTGGSWFSVYDDKTYDDPGKVDIDHMVPLANAWRSGASEWTNEQRGDFANDQERPQLFAVSASQNRAKGDQDPSTWKPASQGYWCTYAQHWITVKHYWKLSITSAEKGALGDMLAKC
ncbi:HNH endonuclease family protein [Catenuloplanes sp. NPDC051500]|uniref:HNH endonuclease family protein n=1 Tax=Catenuloplanes sp. NPDC051500 TaxID=3363959 RepID=UPI00379441A9